jgi:hypothetical protein
MGNVSILTKTYVTLGLVVQALFEFVTAMYVYGNKGEKRNPKLILTLHRIGGYIFAVYLIWPIIVGASLLTRLSRYADGWNFDGPRFFHAMLGVIVLLLLVLKIAFVRFYKNFRPSAKLLGILISITFIITWLIAGGFWLFMMGGRTVP